MQELANQFELMQATPSLGNNPIRSVKHPGKTRVDIYSENGFQGLSFTSRNDKEAVDSIEGNKICTSWRLGGKDPVDDTVNQNSLRFIPNDACYLEE